MKKSFAYNLGKQAAMYWPSSARLTEGLLSGAGLGAAAGGLGGLAYGALSPVDESKKDTRMKKLLRMLLLGAGAGAAAGAPIGMAALDPATERWGVTPMSPDRSEAIIPPRGIREYYGR